jgi:hypothetical protein
MTEQYANLKSNRDSNIRLSEPIFPDPDQLNILVHQNR